MYIQLQEEKKEKKKKKALKVQPAWVPRKPQGTKGTIQLVSCPTTNTLTG